MIETPNITETTSQMTAVIPVVIPRNEIRNVMGPGINELLGTVGKQGVNFAGPVFTRHRRLDPEVFDFEISVPVAASVQAEGRVQPSEWPAETVARTIYHGPYEGLGAAWEEFDNWIVAQGKIPGQSLYESYVAGPESSPDPATWRTELIRTLG